MLRVEGAEAVQFGRRDKQVALPEPAPAAVEHPDLQCPQRDGELAPQALFVHPAQRAHIDAQDGIAEPQERLDREVVRDATVRIPAAGDLGRGEDQRGRRGGQNRGNQPARGEDLGATLDEVGGGQKDRLAERFERVIGKVLAEVGHDLLGVEDPRFRQCQLRQPQR